MAQLRHPETGCPWDLKQDFSSLAPYAIEEAYEVADAIERNDLEDLRLELGDLLLQVVFQQIHFYLIVVLLKLIQHGYHVL